MCVEGASGHLDLTSADYLLTTTRSVRKRLDLTRAVEPEVIETCLAIACQAPSGANAQGWHFIVVVDAEKRAQLAALYRRGADLLAQTYAEISYPAGDPRAGQFVRMVESSNYLYQHLHEVPALVMPCITGRFEAAGVFMQASLYGSVLPAVWSFMLALRARGLGACWTTDHLLFEVEAARVLGIPGSVTQVALLPIAYFTGTDFKPARRLPARACTYWDEWNPCRAHA